MQAFTVDNRVKSAGEFFSMVLEAEEDAAPSATGTVPHLGGFCHRVPVVMKVLVSARTRISIQEDTKNVLGLKIFESALREIE